MENACCRSSAFAWFLIIAVLSACVAAAIAAQAQTFSPLANFDYWNGSAPYYVSLAQGKDGAFYGTTSNGGANGVGTIFKLTSSGRKQ